jgi:hypothetical protein
VEAALRVDIARMSTELASRMVGEPLDVAGYDSPAIQRYLDDLRTATD